MGSPGRSQVRLFELTRHRRLHQRADAEWLAELLMDLEEDEPARLRLVAALLCSLGGPIVETEG